MNTVTKKILEALIIREMGKEDLYRKAITKVFHNIFDTGNIQEINKFLSVIGAKLVPDSKEKTLLNLEKELESAGIDDIRDYCKELGIDPFS